MPRRSAVAHINRQTRTSAVASIPSLTALGGKSSPSASSVARSCGRLDVCTARTSWLFCAVRAVMALREGGFMSEDERVSLFHIGGLPIKVTHDNPPLPIRRLLRIHSAPSIKPLPTLLYLQPWQPSTWNASKSAWIPAPPPESDPAIVQTMGGFAAAAAAAIALLGEVDEADTMAIRVMAVRLWRV